MAQEIADSKLIDTWSSDGLKVKPDISKIIEGWQLGEQPPHEYMNWIQNTFGSKLNHILKNGVASWNNTTQYLAGSSVQHTNNVWLCKTTNTNSEPTDANANWKRIITVESLTTVLGGYVALTGNQTIAGVKTFSSSPIAPTPTAGDNSTKIATTAFVAGVTSSIQTQLNGKQNVITGAGTTITSSNLTSDRALISNSSGKVGVSTVTSTELGYIGGVTSSVQTQLNAKAPLTGAGASGTWGISVTGNAGTVTNGVYTTGNQTIAGVKTFSSSPIVPTPTTGTQVANKAYVDSVVVAVPDASTTVKGIVELATNAETATGTDTTRAITPAGLMSAFNKTGAAPMFACRAWVNFNGIGTVAIRASGNVSSITDNGVGDYKVNFTTPMPNVNYSATGVAGSDAAASTSSRATWSYNFLTSSFNIGVSDNNTDTKTGAAIVCYKVTV